MQTAEGGCRWPRPQVRGLREPSRAKRWAALGRTREVLTRRSVAMYAGGMAPRDLESAWAKARGQCVVSQRAVRDIPDRLPHAYEAWRPRALRGFALASVVLDTVEEPRRRWGRKTGSLWVWGICLDGRTGFRTRSTAQSERAESGLEGWRERVKRGRQTPITLMTAGAPGLIKAIEALGLRSRRMRGGFPTMQHLPHKVPPPAWPAFTALGAAMREAPTWEEGQRRRQPLLAPSQATLPEACRGLEEAAIARLHHLKVPARHRQYGRTSNGAERALAEERRRTKVLPPLWDEAR